MVRECNRCLLYISRAPNSTSTLLAVIASFGQRPRSHATTIIGHLAILHSVKRVDVPRPVALVPVAGALAAVVAAPCCAPMPPRAPAAAAAVAGALSPAEKSPGAGAYISWAANVGAAARRGGLMRARSWAPRRSRARAIPASSATRAAGVMGAGGEARSLGRSGPLPEQGAGAGESGASGGEEGIRGRGNAGERGEHWCKAASEAVARTRDPFAVVDASACLTQDDCDEVLVILPG